MKRTLLTIGASTLWALTLSCGNSCPNSCPSSKALVFLMVVDSTSGATVPAPTFTIDGTRLPANHVSVASVADGGTEGCDCWEVDVPAGMQTVAVAASAHKNILVQVDSGIMSSECCGTLPIRTAFKLLVSLPPN